MNDLEYAVQPSAVPTVLAVYGFRDLAERLESLLESEGELVVKEIRDRFVRVAAKRTTIYEPRRGDFCALFAGRLKDARRVLDRTVSDIDSHASKLGLKVVIGVVELPFEALSPSAALDLADERRNEGSQGLRPPARQSLSARVSSAVGDPPKRTDSINQAGSQLPSRGPWSAASPSAGAQVNRL